MNDLKEFVDRESVAFSHLWHEILAQIPSQFGRLVYLASCHSAEANRYASAALSGICSDDEASRVLSDTHMQAFLEWLQLDLAEQKADLSLYLSGLGGGKRMIARAWLRDGTPAGFIPEDTDSGARDLYLSDLEALLRLWASEDEEAPKAKPLPVKALLIAVLCTAAAAAARALAPGNAPSLILAVLSVAIALTAYCFSQLAAVALLGASLVVVYGLFPDSLRILQNVAYCEWHLPAYIVFNLVLISAIQRLSKCSRVEREAREQYRLAVESASDGILILDRDGTCIEANRKAREMLGYCSAELRHLNLKEAASIGMDCAELRAGKDVLRECSVERKDGTAAMLEASEKLLSNGRVLTILRDITERKKAAERLSRSLEEKELLLKEIHHRVKNNLQVISGLLELESAQQQHPAAAAALQQSQQRIKAIALVHQQLYQSAGMSSIDLPEYLQSLVGAAFQSAGLDSKRVALKMDVDPIHLSLDQAVPCGLIINELVVNCIKHAFPGDARGDLIITARLGANDEVSLCVRDTGVGFPDGLDPRQTSTLGLQLVSALGRQLGGSVEIHNRGGAEVCVSFIRLAANREET